MGLDQFAYKTEQLPSKPVDFEPDTEQDILLCSWRKHPDLHGFMEVLYYAKGGELSDFNCVPVLLLKEDIDLLERTVDEGKLPHTEGFFFGESRPEYADEDHDFIRLARAAIAEGWNVYYTSWW